MKKYWFRPKRFWGIFAAYYPTSWQGWIISVVFITIFCKIFLIVDMYSHSGSDTLIGFAPYAIIIFIVFDFICLHTGEYPSWWKRRSHFFKKK